MAIPMPCIISPASAPTWWNHALRIPERDVVNETSCIYVNKNGIRHCILAYLHIYAFTWWTANVNIMYFSKCTSSHIRQLVCVVKEYNYILRIGIDSLGHGGRPNLWALCKCYSHRANADENPLYQYPFTKINSSLFLDTPWHPQCLFLNVSMAFQLSIYFDNGSLRILMPSDLMQPPLLSKRPCGSLPPVQLPRCIGTDHQAT